MDDQIDHETNFPKAIVTNGLRKEECKASQKPFFQPFFVGARTNHVIFK